MSHHRTVVVFVAAVISLLGILTANRAHASLQSPQDLGEAPKAVAGNVVLAITQSDDQDKASPAWTSASLDGAAGFTEPASAFDPDSSGPFSSADESRSAASIAPDESSNHTKIPEPSTLVLFGTVLIGIGYLSRKRLIP